MPTAQSLITQAMKRLMLDAGETPNASESGDALDALNDLIGQWNIRESMATSATVASTALTANAQPHALVTRVSRVVAASIITGGGTYPIEVVDAMKWNTLTDREISGNWCKYLFYDRGFPTGSCYLSPRPLGGTLLTTGWAAQATFAALSTNNTLLPGYEDALVMCLAVEKLGPMFEVTPNEMLVISYKSAMDEIARLNAQLWGSVQPVAA